jgi:hypothetical protein
VVAENQHVGLGHYQITCRPLNAATRFDGRFVDLVRTSSRRPRAASPRPAGRVSSTTAERTSMAVPVGTRPRSLGANHGFRAKATRLAASVKEDVRPLRRLVPGRRLGGSGISLRCSRHLGACNAGRLAWRSLCSQAHVDTLVSPAPATCRLTVIADLSALLHAYHLSPPASTRRPASADGKWSHQSQLVDLSSRMIQRSGTQSPNKAATVIRVAMRDRGVRYSGGCPAAA